MNYLSILFFIFISSCAFNESRNGMNKRENKTIEEQNKITRDVYNSITGLYEGKLSLENEERPISIGLYTVDVKDGSSSHGEPIFKPFLKAVYKQLDPIDFPVVMDVRYIPESGSLTFINPTDQKSVDALNTINAKIHNNYIEGEAIRSAGRFGSIYLKLVSKDVTTNPTGEEKEYINKLREQYQKVVGTYQGSIVREANMSEPRREWKIELSIYIVEVKYGTEPSGEPKFRPILKARIKQLSPVKPNTYLEVHYDFEKNELVLTSSDPSTTLNPDSINTIVAVFDGKSISGRVSKTAGYWGELNVDFKNKRVEFPAIGDKEEYNQRLYAELQSIAGLYKGTIRPLGLESFDIELKIFVVSEVGGNGSPPILKAYYRRTKDIHRATDLTMTAIYKTEMNPSAIDMTGQRTGSGFTYSVTLNGIIKNKKIEGIYHDQRGQEGPFILKWESQF